jgi:hypothetical protein
VNLSIVEGSPVELGGVSLKLRCVFRRILIKGIKQRRRG